jgi:DNA recombination protein RmuC
MVILAVLLAIVGSALVAGAVAAFVLRSLRSGVVADSGTALTAAVESLNLERDTAMDALRAELEAERRQLAIEREQALQATVDTVLAVAGDKLGSHTQQASHDLQLRSEAIDQRVAGMNDELRRVRELVGQLQKEKAEQHGQLVQGIDHAIRASAALTDTAQSLREALSNSRARGQWGERMADDVLRVAGLVEGVNYRRQQTLASGCRPDFTFTLPRGRLLHMDVKFPIDNYLRVLDASAETERVTHTRAFLRDVRARVRELAGRGYIDADTTVGYVLLFIPNESVYGFIHEHDAGLLDEALAGQVVMCSPCTLFAVLGVVRQAVDNFLLEKTSDEILECLNGFGSQWQAFSDRLDRLGSQFATAQRTYDELAGTRRRMLQKQLDRVDRLRSARGLDELGGDGPSTLDLSDDGDDDDLRGDGGLVSVDPPVGGSLDPLGGDDGLVDAAGVGVVAMTAESGGRPQPAVRRVPRLRPVRAR